MKKLIKTRAEMKMAGRWDIDFHSPAEIIKKFPKELLCRVDSVADVARDKRDPTKSPGTSFQYIDISSIDVSVGVISNPQELLGEEAPSRARKVVRAFDIVVSTCRPTRGAIAVVPKLLHNQVASTGFSILRPHTKINPFYLHYALRLPSTLEQFRKWSTGSSYPAILDEDVAKTLIPVPDLSIQNEISNYVVNALERREKAIQEANKIWVSTLESIEDSLGRKELKLDFLFGIEQYCEQINARCTADEIRFIIEGLPEISTDKTEIDDSLILQKTLPFV